MKLAGSLEARAASPWKAAAVSDAVAVGDEAPVEVASAET